MGLLRKEPDAQHPMWTVMVAQGKLVWFRVYLGKANAVDRVAVKALPTTLKAVVVINNGLSNSAVVFRFSFSCSPLNLAPPVGFPTL